MAKTDVLFRKKCIVNFFLLKKEKNQTTSTFVGSLYKQRKKKSC